MRKRSIKAIGGGLQHRALLVVALASVLALVSLGAIPVGASLLFDSPMPAWAGGNDEAVADEGNGSNVADAASADSAASAASNASTTQAAASASGSAGASSADSAASASTGSSANQASGGATPDRGYVGPWYALNSDYVVQVEERFDAITEDEYTTSVARTALTAGAAVAAVLAIIMLVRAHKAQSKIRKRRR